MSGRMTPGSPSRVGLVFVEPEQLRARAAVRFCAPLRRRTGLVTLRPYGRWCCQYLLFWLSRQVCSASFSLQIPNVSLLGQKVPSGGFSALTFTQTPFLAQNVVCLDERSVRCADNVCVSAGLPEVRSGRSAAPFHRVHPPGFWSVCPIVTDTGLFQSLQLRGQTLPISIGFLLCIFWSFILSFIHI